MVPTKPLVAHTALIPEGGALQPGRRLSPVVLGTYTLFLRWMFMGRGEAP